MPVRNNLDNNLFNVMFNVLTHSLETRNHKLDSYERCLCATHFLSNKEKQTRIKRRITNINSKAYSPILRTLIITVVTVWYIFWVKGVTCSHLLHHIF